MTQSHSYDRLIDLMISDGELAVFALTTVPSVALMVNDIRVLQKYFNHYDNDRGISMNTLIMISSNTAHRGNMLNIFADVLSFSYANVRHIDLTVKELEMIETNDKYQSMRIIRYDGVWDSNYNLDADAIDYLYSKGRRTFSVVSWCVASIYKPEILKYDGILFNIYDISHNIIPKYLAILAKKIAAFVTLYPGQVCIDLCQQNVNYLVSLMTDADIAILCKYCVHGAKFIARTHGFSESQIRRFLVNEDKKMIDATVQAYSTDNIAYDNLLCSVTAIINNPHADPDKIVELMIKNNILPTNKNTFTHDQIARLDDEYRKNGNTAYRAILKKAKKRMGNRQEITSFIRDLQRLPEDYFALIVMYCDSFFVMADTD